MKPELSFTQQRGAVGNAGDTNEPAMLHAINAERGQQGQLAPGNHGGIIRSREKKSAWAAWALSLLINTLCVILFLIAFTHNGAQTATSGTELSANSRQQGVDTTSNPLLAEPEPKTASQAQFRAIGPAAKEAPAADGRTQSHISRKKLREYKLKKELHRLQLDFLKDAPQ